MEEILEVEQIKKILPQRYPFLMIDRVIEIDPGIRVVAIKNLSITESFFRGHFPDQPVMPGVLMTEAMAQASIILYWSKYKDELKRMPTYYLGSVNVKFKKPVVPGDQLVIESKATKIIPKAGFVEVKVSVNNVVVAQGEATFAVKR